MFVLPEPVAFLWDAANKEKNLWRHGLRAQEIEEVFFDEGKKLYADVLHSGREERYLLIGKTKLHRLLFIVFTVRHDKIRVISARNLNRKEYHLYEENDQETT